MLLAVSEIGDLHEALFGFLPAKRGAAYERLTAVVLAVFGWTDIQQDTREGVEGKRAKHQLDVTARQPTGLVRRLIAECKDWDRKVGKSTLDALVGVLGQLNVNNGAVVTTKDFTKGARAVAADNDIALLVIRPFDTEDPTPYVKRIELTINAFGSVYSDFNVQTPQDLPPNPRIRMGSETRLLRTDGSPAESFAEIMQAHHGPPLQEGTYPQRLTFEDGRLLPLEDGDTIPLLAITWTETVVSSPTITVTEAEGEPVLVVQQLGEDGGVDNGRIVVDRELFAWDIDADGKVTPRGSLIPE
jgi:hypothetical protein